MHKRFFIFLFGTGLWCGLAFAEVCQTLVITGPPNSPPSSWIMDQKLVGASVEFVEILALAAGVKKVEKKVFNTWTEALDATRLGQVDLIFSAAFSAERERFLNFIRPSYAGQNLYVVVRKGEGFPLLKYEDLLGRRGGAGVGESYGGGKFDQFVSKKLDLVRSPNISDSLELLFNNKVDYVLGFENAVNSEIFTKNLLGKLDIVLTYPSYADTYLALSKRSKCSSLVTTFSDEIKKADKKNLYYMLSKKYMKNFEQFTSQ
jgi:polar amino acid transport system substrate-binding protein